MPNRNDVLQDIMSRRAGGQDAVRRAYLADLATYTGRDTILYCSAFTSKKLAQLPGFLVSITIEDVQNFMGALHGLKGDNLDLILHSPGGSLEAADQIVQYLRAKYKHIRVIVPQNAMSAATAIACAADEIIMGKHSALGPIDPQMTFPTQNGHVITPAQSILDEFQQAKAEVIADPRTAPLWASRIQNFPPGFLHVCQQTIQLSIQKVAEWLDAYMFASAPGNPSGTIAAWLGNASVHKTHGRPITMALAQSIGLCVTALEADQLLQEKVLSVFHAATITHELTDCVKLTENHHGRGAYLNVQLRSA